MAYKSSMLVATPISLSKPLVLSFIGVVRGIRVISVDKLVRVITHRTVFTQTSYLRVSKLVIDNCRQVIDNNQSANPQITSLCII